MGLYRRREGRGKGVIWWFSYYSEGRQIRESSGSSNKRNAAKLLAMRKGQVLEDRWNLPKSRTPKLKEFAPVFLKSIRHENTRDRYSSSIKHWIDKFGEARIAEISVERIIAFQQERLQKGISPATVNRDTNTLSSLMRRAKRLRLISRNPCSDLEKLDELRQRRQAKPLSYEEEARITNAAVSPWLKTLITMLADTGLRVRKEALPLKWSDVNLDSEPAYLQVRDSKSAAGIRTVWLTKHCSQCLQRWKRMFGPEFSDYVFASPRNPKVHLTDYRGAWRRAARAAGLPDRRTYDLRSTFASRANGCNASSTTIAQLLGHAHLAILPTYIKPLDENTKALIEALDSARSSHREPSIQ